MNSNNQLTNNFIYASLVIPVAGSGMPIFVYILPFYADELMLGMTTVSIIFFLGRFIDVFTDPVMGFLIDRYQTKSSKHKHWVLLAIPLITLSTYLLYFPGDNQVSNSYFFSSLFLLYSGFTLLVITQLSWSLIIAPSYDNRTNLMTLREFMALIGMFIVIAIPSVIEIYTPEMQAKIEGIGWFVIISTPLIILAAFIRLPDKSSFSNNIPLKDSLLVFKKLFNNKDVNRIVIVGFLIAFAQGLSGGLFLIIVDSIFDLKTYGSRAMLAYFLMSVVGLWVWRTISVKTSKHLSLSICCFYAVGILLIYFFGINLLDNLSNVQKIIFLFSFVILFGFAFSGPNPLINGMIGDLSQIQKIKDNTDIGGSIYSYLTTLSKFGLALAIAVPYILLEQVFGFQIKLGASNEQEIKSALWNIYIFAPMICYLVSGFLILRHNVNRSDLEIDREL